MRFSTAASGTSFTRTQIFTKASPWSPEPAASADGGGMLPTPLTDESIGAGNRDAGEAVRVARRPRALATVARRARSAARPRSGASALDVALADQPQGGDRARDGEDPAEHQDLVEPGEEALAGGVRNARAAPGGTRPRPGRGGRRRPPPPAHAAVDPVARGRACREPPGPSTRRGRGRSLPRPRCRSRCRPGGTCR